mmetsp:Transcript_10503/g.42846  ORF Transcript_10503/g.42846 Transcript_10503/m.42846 type:complete len:200 (+) Transcript_10503:737-1336(+)
MWKFLSSSFSKSSACMEIPFTASADAHSLSAASTSSSEELSSGCAAAPAPSAATSFWRERSSLTTKVGSSTLARKGLKNSGLRLLLSFVSTETPQTRARRLAAAMTKRMCSSSSSSNLSGVGKRLGGDQKRLPSLVRASSGKFAMSVATRLWKYSSNLRRAQATQSWKVRVWYLAQSATALSFSRISGTPVCASFRLAT